MKPQPAADTLESRRFEALELFGKGEHQAAIARLLKVSRQSVSRWIDTSRQKGRKGLKRRPRPGRTPKLSPTQRETLLGSLAKGPQEYGYSTQLWTSDRICRLVRERFGVTYHNHHVPKLLRQCGWSYQKPATRALERDERKIRRWLAVDWPRVKKKSSA